MLHVLNDKLGVNTTIEDPHTDSQADVELDKDGNPIVK